MSKSVQTGTIVTGGTSQVVDAAKSGRLYIEIINISDTVMYLNFGAAATVDHIPLAANGGKWVSNSICVPKNSINILCASNNKKFAYLIN